MSYLIPVRFAPLSVVTALLAMFLANPNLHAKKANKVHQAFKGKILVSDDALPAVDPENPGATIREYKKLAITTVKGDVVDGVASWNFHFMAFMKKKPNSSNLTLKFFTTDKEKLFVADKRLTGADPSVQLLTSTIRISEDENLNRGSTYDMKLVVPGGKTEVVLASVRLTMK